MVELSIKSRFVGHKEGITPIIVTIVANRTVKVRIKNMKRDIFHSEARNPSFKSHVNTVKFKIGNFTF